MEWPVEEIEKINKYIKANSFIQNFFPCPKELNKLKSEFKDEQEKNDYFKKIKDKYWTTDWYNRRCDNRWCKRDVYPCLDERRPWYLGISFDSPRSPPLWALEKLSALHPWVSILIRYEEWGMDFSWEAVYLNGFEDYHERFDDAYFWEWVECIICWTQNYNDSDTRSDDSKKICEDCYSRINNHKLHCDICGTAHILTKKEVKNWDYYACNLCRKHNPNLPKNTYTDLEIVDYRN